MNEATKQFFVKLYLQQASSNDYVDWAIACLEEDLDSKNLRLLAGLNRNHPIKADFEEYFRKALSELNWDYPNEKEVLLNHSKDLARKILSGELEPVKGCEQIHEIYNELNFPDELQYWSILDEGNSPEWEDKGWIPGVWKYNHEKWLEAVMREARYLVERDFS